MTLTRYRTPINIDVGGDGKMDTDVYKVLGQRKQEQTVREKQQNRVSAPSMHQNLITISHWDFSPFIIKADRIMQRLKQLEIVDEEEKQSEGTLPGVVQLKRE